MNRSTFFSALIGLLAAPFAWAASKLRADQLQAGSTGVQRILTIGTDNKFASLGIGAGLSSDGTVLSVTPVASPAPAILTRNADGTYPYTGGTIFRNGILQVPVGSPPDYTVTGATITFTGGNNPDDQVVRI